MENFYEQLKNVCKEHNTTIYAIEKATGASKGSFIKWRTSSPSTDKLIEIADFLGVSMDYLIGREIPQTKKAVPEARLDTTQNNRPIPRIENKMTFKYTEKSTGIVYELPINKQCPICGFPNAPEFLGAFPTFKKDIHSRSNSYIGLFACNSCGKLYSVLYEKPLRTNIFNGTNYDYLFGAVTPMPTVDSCYTPYQPPLPEIKDCFDEVSFSKFREAYRDVGLAESFGINGLVGIAYRRAVDFLVRDFFIYKNFPQTKNIPQEEQLSVLIKALPDDRIKSFAATINILANDYTHYVNHHTDKDINDIKQFFELLLHRLEEELQYGNSLNLSGIERYNLPAQSFDIAKTQKSKKAIATEFAKNYEELIQNENFQKTAKLFNYIDASVRLLAYNVIREWLYNRGVPVKTILGE